MAFRALLLAVLALSIFAGDAAATTYCVPDPTAGSSTCPEGTTTVSSVQQALDLAGSNPGADRVTISACACTFSGGTYLSSQPVEIVGAGRGSTELTGSPALALGSSARVSDLTVSLEDDESTGLSLSGALAERVDVVAVSTTYAKAVRLEGGTFQDGQITLPPNAGNVGIQLLGDSIVRRVHLSAPYGVTAAKGETRLEDVVVDLRKASASNATGLSLGADGAAVSLNVNHLTIAGNGGDGQSGVSVTATGPGRSGALSLRNSVIAGVGHPLVRLASNGGVANLSTDYSDYDPAGNVDINSGGGEGSLGEAHALDLDPGFADPDAGNFELGAGSGLIDAGDPAPPGPGDSPTDLRGGSRVVDGNGDCVARRDIGAYEFAPASPFACLPPALPPTPSPAPTAAAVQTAPASSVPQPPMRRPRSLVLIAARVVALTRSGIAPVPLRCAGAHRCSGVLTLTTARPVEITRRSRLRLGSSRFSIPPGRTGRVRVRLARAKARLVAKVGRVAARAVVRDRDDAGRRRTSTRTITLRTPRRARRSALAAREPSRRAR